MRTIKGSRAQEAAELSNNQRQQSCTFSRCIALMYPEKKPHPV